MGETFHRYSNTSCKHGLELPKNLIILIYRFGQLLSLLFLSQNLYYLFFTLVVLFVTPLLIRKRVIPKHTFTQVCTFASIFVRIIN